MKETNDRSAEIRVRGSVAKLNGATLTWSSDDARLQEILNKRYGPRSDYVRPAPYLPNPVGMMAREVAEKMGGELIAAPAYVAPKPGVIN